MNIYIIITPNNLLIVYNNLMESNTLNKEQNKTKIEKKNKDKNEKIIKRSWKKITIIVSIIVILLSGIGVGFYFIFRPHALDLKSSILNNSKKSIKDAKDEILNNKTEKNIGLFFYKKDGSATNYMTYGNSAGTKGDYSSVEGIGPFSYWVDNSDTTKTTWYSIDMDSTKNLEEDLFLVENGNDGYELDTRMIDGDWSEGFDSQSNVAEGSSSWSDATKQQLDVKEGKEDDKKEPYKGWKVMTRSGDDPTPPEPEPDTSLMNNGSNTTEEEFIIQEGSTIIFNKDGKIKGLVNGYDYSTSIDHDNEEDFRIWYKTFFDDFVNLQEK